MEKPVVSPRRFVELLNARLPSHPLFREGMRVYGVPRHAEHPRSLVCVGPRGSIGVCTAIETIVRGECDVEPDIPREWRHALPPSSPNQRRSQGQAAPVTASASSSSLAHL